MLSVDTCKRGKTGMAQRWSGTDTWINLCDCFLVRCCLKKKKKDGREKVHVWIYFFTVIARVCKKEWTFVEIAFTHLYTKRKWNIWVLFICQEHEIWQLSYHRITRTGLSMNNSVKETITKSDMRVRFGLYKDHYILCFNVNYIHYVLGICIHS